MNMTNILVLGAGFGGIGAALELEKKLKNKEDYKITLIDRNNFHLFTPSLYEVATIYGLIEDNFAKYLRGSVSIPIGEIIENKKINFVQAEIKEINLKEKFVLTNGETKLDFDYLIIALGGETEFYGIPGVQEYAFNFKLVDDAIGVYRKIKDLYEKFRQPRSRSTKDRRNWGRQGAERQRFPASHGNLRRAPSEGGGAPSEINIAVIGGGFTGVELAAELGCCVSKIIDEYKLNKTCTQIFLFEAGPKILPAINERARKIIEKRLTSEMVEIQTNSAVTEVGSDYIRIHPVKSALPKLNSSEYLTGRGGAAEQQFDGVKDRGELLNFDLIIWAGGVHGSRLLETLELKLTKKGTIEANEFLQTKNQDNSINDKIFAIGDSVSFIDPKTQKPVPAMAYVTYDQADVAAENVVQSIKNQKLKPYNPFYDAWIAPVGGKWAYFHYKSLNIAGFWGYCLRQSVDLRYFLKILPLNKAFSLFFKDLVIFTKND